MESYSNCAHCGHDLKGRTDKRFCNDTCRNTYNRIQRQQRHIPFPEQAKEIIQAIKRNYQIIASKDKSGGNIYISSKLEDYLAKGFEPKYFTSIHMENNDEQWYCIFDWYFYIAGNMIHIKNFIGQFQIK